MEYRKRICDRFSIVLIVCLFLQESIHIPNMTVYLKYGHIIRCMYSLFFAFIFIGLDSPKNSQQKFVNYIDYFLIYAN